MAEITPQEIEKRKQEIKEAHEKKLREENEARLAINGVENPNVRKVLQYIMRLSGYQLNPAAIGSDGELKHTSLEYNVGRQSVYHDLRRLMSAETKNIVERSE